MCPLTRLAPSVAIDGRELGNLGTGIGRYTDNLIKKIIALDPSTHYFVLTNEANITFGKYRNLTVLSYQAKKRSAWEMKFVPEVMRKYNINLFHNTRSGNTFFKPLQFPYITTVHDIIPLKFENDFPSKIMNRWKNDFSPYINQAKHIISVSHKTKEDLVAYTGINKEKVSVIYQGINQNDQMLTKAEAKLQLAKHYGLEHPYILSVGRKQKYKNVEVLIKAYSLFPDEIKNRVKLVISGIGAEEYENIIDELSLKEHVKSFGYVPEKLLPSLYLGSELFVFPSLYEGFGFPPLEAMSYGVPVVSSNMETMLEVLGEAALFFDPNNPVELAEKMREVLSDSLLRTRMWEAGVKQVEKYSWEETARQTINVYQSIIR